MSNYKYEMHAHTSEASKCGVASGAEIAGFFHKLGYAGVCITDHFFNGNTAVPSNLPWAERVELFCSGYEHARVEGEKLGIDVFFGWEYAFSHAEFLTYGLDKNWLLSHPELLQLRISEYCSLVHSSGGFIIQAHPFREASYIETILLAPWHVDGVEVLNTHNSNEENMRASRYAKSYNLCGSAGSDIHRLTQQELAGVALKKRASDIGELTGEIKSGEARIFRKTLPSPVLSSRPV